MRYEKAITYQNQVTIAIKYSWVVRITTEMKQTAGHHWCDIFMGYL